MPGFDCSMGHQPEAQPKRQCQHGQDYLMSDHKSLKGVSGNTNALRFLPGIGNQFSCAHSVGHNQLCVELGDKIHPIYLEVLWLHDKGQKYVILMPRD